MSLAAALAVVANGCRHPADAPRPPATPRAALRRLVEAVQHGDLAGAFELLGQQSRWSVMSVHEDLREVCSLVRAHYPRERQARALERCAAAGRTGDPAAFFAALAAERHLLDRLKGVRASAGAGTAAGGDRVALRAAGAAAPLPFCRERAEIDRREVPRWGYCGLDDELEQLKVKAARDLLTTRENVESFRQRR